MPRYSIRPLDTAFATEEFTAIDAAPVLDLVGRLDCGAVDVIENDVYTFSVRLGSNGIWSIYRRD